MPKNQPQKPNALNFDDDVRSAALKCREIVSKLNIAESTSDGGELADEAFVRGRDRRAWHDVLFRKATEFHSQGETYKTSLDRALEWYDDTQRSAAPETWITASRESLLRMFRDWRKAINSGADRVSKYESDDFWQAIIEGRFELAGEVFVSLSRQTKRNIIQRSARYFL